MVVPCCVFSRLFPGCKKPSTDESSIDFQSIIGDKKDSHGMGGVVSSYYNLIDWLVAKHPAIHVTLLPFAGVNFAVRAMFQC